MKSVLKIFIVLVMFYDSSYAQVMTWQRILNNSGHLRKAQQTNDGNYIAVGTSGANGYSKIILVKFSQYGDTLWKSFLGSPSNENYDGYWVEQTHDNGFIIAGAGPGTVSDAYLMKTDSNGIFQWEKHFGGGDLDQAYCVQQTSDKGYILAIRTTSFSSTNDIMIVKTDSCGKLIWQNIYNYTIGTHDFANEIRLIKNYGYIVAATTGSTLNAFAYLLRLNLEGDTLWTKKYSVDSFAGCNSMDTVSDGGFVLGGSTTSYANPELKSFVLRTDSTGLLLWQRSFKGEMGEEECNSIKVIPNRGYVMAGVSDTPNIPFSVSGFIRILNFTGDVIYQKYYNPGNDDDYFNFVDNTNDGGFILAGTSKFRNQPSKLYLVKTDSMGYAPVGIINSELSLLQDFKLFQNYPNPFNSSTKIEYKIPFKAKIRLILYDALGRMITSFNKGVEDQGEHQFIFNAEKFNLSSGVYFIQLRVDEKIDYTLTKAIIHLK